MHVPFGKDTKVVNDYSSCECILKNEISKKITHGCTATVMSKNDDNMLPKFSQWLHSAAYVLRFTNTCSKELYSSKYIITLNLKIN